MELFIVSFVCFNIIRFYLRDIVEKKIWISAHVIEECYFYYILWMILYREKIMVSSYFLLILGSYFAYTVYEKESLPFLNFNMNNDYSIFCLMIVILKCVFVVMHHINIVDAGWCNWIRYIMRTRRKADTLVDNSHPSIVMHVVNINTYLQTASSDITYSYFKWKW